MKKSLFVSLIFWVICFFAFALGMCMVLLPEWNDFMLGVVLSSIGFVGAMVIFFLYEKSIGKVFHRPSRRVILAVVITLLGIILFGLGMCFSMVWNNIIVGVFLGLIGVLLLLSLIPIFSKIKE